MTKARESGGTVMRPLPCLAVAASRLSRLACLSRLALLAGLLAAPAACSSQPSTDRPASPSRPEVQRPAGVEPDGLADVRDALADQRAETREMENVLLVKPDTQTVNPSTWVEDVLTFPLRFLGLW